MFSDQAYLVCLATLVFFLISFNVFQKTETDKAWTSPKQIEATGTGRLSARKENEKELQD